MQWDGVVAEGVVRLWQRLEVVLEAHRSYANPYTEVEVWADLEGPGFARRCYGFWDGGARFVIRLTAPRIGQWQWRTGSNTNDPGLSGHNGRFEAAGWSATEIAENETRRGMVGVTPDGRGLQYADGTPFFLLGDTWWSLPSYRFPLCEGDDIPRQLGPGATLNDYVHYRKAQGFNSVAILAAQPAWRADGKPRAIRMADGTWIRQGWDNPPTETTKDMHNEGGMPFEFPGKVPGFESVFPDVDRVNPKYFQVLDRKIDYLNHHGFVPFVEVARRDTGQAWWKFHDWPLSYARFVQYVFARLQANITLLSPIHYDSWRATIPGRVYNEACNYVIDRWGRPPFGTLLSANSNPSTYTDFGGSDECRWLDLHQIGNTREHHSYWWLTDIHRLSPPKPALNGEPYYAGLSRLGTPYPLRTTPNSEEDETYVRSGLYGSFLSGGLAGFIYGAEGIWQSDIDPGSPFMMWDAFQWRSAAQVQHLRSFAMVRGTRYRTLVPEAEMVVPNKTGPAIAYTGWAYCAASPERDWFMLYFERDAAMPAVLRGARYRAKYRPNWFDPRSGAWQTPAETIEVGEDMLLQLPSVPDARDWGLMLEMA
jgi:Protein of unknown function (DUF4038)/Domain of unknown function (DUF5060)/Putative collagen-binding domain of a collagenase